MSALEAFLNSMSEELFLGPQLTLQEKSILSEKEIVFKSGQFELGSQLKIYRITDRIEFLYRKFSHKSVSAEDSWYQDIVQSIKLRNDLVHPKDTIELDCKKAEKVLQSILETVNVLYLSIYSRKLPIYSEGLQSTLDF